MLTQVRHANIIRFVDCLQDETFCYLVTEMHGTPWTEHHQRVLTQQPLRSCPPMDLFECIERHQRFSERHGRFIFRQIAAAVAHLYSLGLVHRDIKDENILIDDKFHVKLIDFGSVAFFDPTKAKQYDRFLGTIQYAAPEILRGQHYSGPATEVWALGCCLYIILTGQVTPANSGSVRYCITGNEPYLFARTRKTQQHLHGLHQVDAMLRPE
jgi:serine/threonine protein kinase